MNKRESSLPSFLLSFLASFLQPAVQELARQAQYVSEQVAARHLLGAVGEGRAKDWMSSSSKKKKKSAPPPSAIPLHTHTQTHTQR